VAVTQQRFTRSTKAAQTSAREAFRVAPTGTVGFIEARALEQECLQLLDQGAARLVLDLARTEQLGPAALGTIAAIERHARRLGARFSVALGDETVTRTLSRAGLLGQLEVEGARDTFFEWTR
jgi:anti-anti-sigma factor